MLQKLKDQVGEQKAVGWINCYGNISFGAEHDLELAASIKEQAELYMNAILLGETLPKIHKDLISTWQKILESCCEEIRHAITWITCVAEKTKNISEIKKKIIIDKLHKEQLIKEYFEGLAAVYRVGERILAAMTLHVVTDGPSALMDLFNDHWHTLQNQLKDLELFMLLPVPLPPPMPVRHLLGHNYCALSLCQFRRSDKKITWFGKVYNLECANFWICKISGTPPF